MFKYLLHVLTFPKIHVYYPDKQGKEQVRNYQPTFMYNQKHLSVHNYPDKQNDRIFFVEIGEPRSWFFIHMQTHISVTTRDDKFKFSFQNGQASHYQTEITRHWSESFE